MSEIQRLLRIAARRNGAGEYGTLRVRLLKVQIKALRAQLTEDGISGPVLFEAVLKGYLQRHPAVLAMIDQWKRDELPKSVDIKSLSDQELDDIYAAIGGGMVEE